MEPFDPESQSVLRYHDLFGRGTFARALDLLVGIFFGVMAVRFSSHVLFLYGFGALASYFGLSGLAGLLFKRGVTIDRGRGRVHVWRGFLFPLWFRTRSLDRYNTVLLAKDVRRVGRRYRTVFTVQLVGTSRSDEVTARKDYLKARQTAEQVAVYLGFDLLDTTPSQPVRTAAADVGKPLREQVRAATAAAKTSDPGYLDLSPLPRRSHLVATVDGSWLFVEIPRRRFLGLMKRPVVTGLVLAAIGAAIGFGLYEMPSQYLGRWHEHVIPALTAALGAAGFLFSMIFRVLPRAFVRYEIEAHSGALTVRRRGLIFRGTSEMPSADLRELRGNGGYVQAIGRDRIERFGNDGLTKAEVEWLREAITKAIAA